MLDTMKKVDPIHSERLKALQAKLDKSDEDMAEKFGVPVRTYVSWKYKERNPSKTALTLLGIFWKQAKLG
jgi:DNA-binding transcriptional regulator YiaG